MRKYTILFFTLFIILISNAQPKLVGMTAAGGTNGEGGILRYTGGSSSLSGSCSFPINSSGYGPQCATLTLAPNGKFYGLDANTNGGVDEIIEYDYPTNVSTIVATIPNPHNVNMQAAGALILASNGTLYGLTGFGGANFGGTLFSYAIGSNSISTLVNMPATSNPKGSLMQATDSKLYGFTLDGGSNQGGTLFQFDITTDSFTVLYSLPANAAPVLGSLLEIGADSLYGVTTADGLNQSGTIFRYVVGSGTYTILYSFGSSSTPNGDLIRATDGKIYGTTQMGGTYGGGTLFSFDISSNTYSNLHDFANPNTTDGSTPDGGMMQASDGMLYGMTNQGGFCSVGTIFQYDISNSTYTKNVDLCHGVWSPEGGHMTEYIPASGIAGLNNYHFNLSPNPTNGSLSITNNYNGTLSVNIINLLGERLKTFTMISSQQSFDISDLAAGIYEVQVSDATQALKVMKVVKE